jgi:hypothetical protein
VWLLVACAATAPPLLRQILDPNQFAFRISSECARLSGGNASAMQVVPGMSGRLDRSDFLLPDLRSLAGRRPHG